MKLRDLNATFLDSAGGIRGAGVQMDCPCGDRDENHQLFVPFKVALDGSTRPGDKGWDRTGDTIDTLTLSPSVLRVHDCKWHGWIRNGEAVSC